MGDRLLLVKGVPGQTSLLVGTLAAMDDEAMRRLLAQTEARSQVGARFLPQMMDTHDYAGSANIWLPLGGLLAIFAAVWGTMGFLRWRVPKTHPVAQKLKSAGALAAVSKVIERDMALKTNIKLSSTTLTPSFAVQQSLLKLEVQPLNELLWAYQKVVQKKIYYVIPAGKNYSLCLHFFDGKSMDLAGKEEAVRHALEFLIEQAPWALYGHSEDIAAVYKDKRQRGRLAAQVKQRQAAIRAAAVPPTVQAA
ncbi:MAG: hypothetical protein C4K60_19695 [Ideonella sp. MAG2]|nr:MAG: hypothetical protein C4K60_19695 [Ideonella sp. MAG2]